VAFLGVVWVGGGAGGGLFPGSINGAQVAKYTKEVHPPASFAAVAAAAPAAPAAARYFLDWESRFM